MEQGVPPNHQMVEHISNLLDPAAQRAVEFVESMLDLTGAGVYPPLGASEIDAAFTHVATQVMFGQLTPEAAAAQFMAQAQEILDRNQ